MWCPPLWKVDQQLWRQKHPRQILRSNSATAQVKTDTCLLSFPTPSPCYRRHDTINFHCPMFVIRWQQKTQCYHHCARDARTRWLGQQTILYLTRGHQTTREIVDACRCTKSAYPGIGSYVCTYEGILDGHDHCFPVPHAFLLIFFSYHPIWLSFSNYPC